jgi:transcriptional regulator with XRE-family HTH domain
MNIGRRLRELSEGRNLSQPDLEKRTGLLRFHISRRENGHDSPKIQTLQKTAAAFKIPLYQLLYECERNLKPRLSHGSPAGTYTLTLTAASSGVTKTTTAN